MDILKIRDKNLAALCFKDNAIKNSQIENLQDINAELSVDNAVRINAVVSDEFKKEILETAKILKPWRKGPFEIFDTFIDSEWQSNIKYNILKPHINLQDKIVADVGCNNGYYLFRMLKFSPKKLIGFDPSVHTFLQFKFLNKFAKTQIKYELLGVEHLPFYEHKFDTIFCLGVIYHRSDPIKMLKDLKASLNSDGEVILDTMFISGESEICLSPRQTYSKIPNIYFIPTIKALQNWCERAKFREFEVLDIRATDENEQRKTEWILGESLGDFLDPNDKTKTIEGYEAPKRVYARLKI